MIYIKVSNKKEYDLNKYFYLNYLKMSTFKKHNKRNKNIVKK